MRHALERPTVDDRALVESVRRSARPLQEGDLSGYDPLIDFVGDAHIALIGEASHGTHEFYRERALITSRLINELGFSFVAIEGDWPEASRVRQYVQGGPGTARDASSVFNVFPTWMWGNLDPLHFVEGLRRYNSSIEGTHKVGFYGLDLYSTRAATMFRPGWRAVTTPTSTSTERAPSSRLPSSPPGERPQPRTPFRAVTSLK
jgi:erythromycin esterase-like protein